MKCKLCGNKMGPVGQETYVCYCKGISRESNYPQAYAKFLQQENVSLYEGTKSIHLYVWPSSWQLIYSDTSMQWGPLLNYYQPNGVWEIDGVEKITEMVELLGWLG